MRPDTRAQLRELDRALLALASERARLLAEVSRSHEPGTSEALEDLLRRYDGPLGAQAVRALFAALDHACRSVREEGLAP